MALVLMLRDEREPHKEEQKEALLTEGISVCKPCGVREAVVSGQRKEDGESGVLR